MRSNLRTSLCIRSISSDVVIAVEDAGLIEAALFLFRLLICERTPSGVSNLHARHVERALASDHALGLCRRQPGADQVNQLLDREALRSS
jgi:hypothetical protein